MAATQQSDWRPSSTRRLRVVRYLLGALLLVAAGLKLYGLQFSPAPQIGWMATPHVQLAVAEWEIVLGIWLMSGAYTVGAWIGAFTTFSAFAIVSAYFGSIGVATCSCFGKIAASPWYVFTLDLFVVLLLAASRPKFGQTISLNAEVGRAALAAGGSLAAVGGLLVALTAVVALIFGSPEVALARLRGEIITVEPKDVNLGTGESGQTLEATIKVKNWSDRRVRLIGGTSDCSCWTTRGLPCSLAPGESKILPVHLRTSADIKGVFSRKAEIVTDVDNQRRLRLTLSGRVE